MHDSNLIVGDIALIRGTSLTGYRGLVAELGADPDSLLRAAGIDPAGAGQHDVFLGYRAVVLAVEGAAAATGAPDFGRRLARRQGVGILGPVGLAVSTARTAGQALVIVERYLSAYSPDLVTRVAPVRGKQRIFVELAIAAENLPPHAQVYELSLGVVLGVLRGLMGPNYSPISVHLPHGLLAPQREYVRDFGCAVVGSERAAGITVRVEDLDRPLRPAAATHDTATHDELLRYLDTVLVADNSGHALPVLDLIGQLLPAGAPSLELVAGQLGLHPRTLQRRLAVEGSSFAGLVDKARRERADRILRETDMPLAQLSRELGYAEQSVLTRACQRWFGCGPSAYRESASTIWSTAQRS